MKIKIRKRENNKSTEPNKVLYDLYQRSVQKSVQDEEKRDAIAESHSYHM